MLILAPWLTSQLVVLLISIGLPFEVTDIEKYKVSQCPSKCECYEFETYLLDVRCNEIIDFKNIPMETTRLTVTSEAIESLEGLNVEMLPFLKWFSLNGSRIDNFDVAAFSKFSKVEDLTINFSPVREFDLSNFITFPAIKSMNFDNNKIEEVTIEHAPPTLGYLRLTSNNIIKLVVIPNEVKKMIKFEIVDLSYNPIQCNCMLWKNITELGFFMVIGTCYDAKSNTTLPLSFPKYGKMCRGTEFPPTSSQKNCNQTQFCKEQRSTHGSSKQMSELKLPLFAVLMVDMVLHYLH